MNKYYKIFVYMFVSCFYLIGFSFLYQKPGFLQYPEESDGIFSLIGSTLSTDKNDLGNENCLGTGDSTFLKETNSILKDLFGIGFGISLVWRDSPHIGEINLITYGYIVFILISIFILFFLRKQKREKKLKLLFYIGLRQFLTIGIFDIVGDNIALNHGLHGFKKDMSYFQLLDYYGFVDKIRDELDLDFNKKTDCKFLIEYGTDFRTDMFGPIDIYLKPCELDLVGGLVDYKVYYKKEISEEDSDKKVLLEYNGSYLLENNIE